MNALMRQIERKLWAFPVLVVLCAAVAFLFGGTCAAWQWYLPLVVVAAWGQWRSAPRESAAATALFLLWIAVVWVLCGISVAPGWFDEGCYHLPAVRMLVNGWNPLCTRAPEDLAALFGLSMDECRFWHIAYMARPVWIFNAVAYFFTRDVFHPMLPAMLFVFPAAVLKLWRTMGSRAWWWKVAACGMLVCLTPGSMYVVDAVVALAAVSLLLSFDEALSGKSPDWPVLALSSFWLMGAKGTGLVHGGIFWIIYFAFAWRDKALFRRSWLCAAVVAGLLVVGCASPYITSLIDHGHPFYPKCTFDEKNHPVHDITADFLSDRNADAKAMGYVGFAVNAYVCPALARAWYRLKTGRRDFCPHSAIWEHYPSDTAGVSATRLIHRTLLWVALAVLLLLKRHRATALMVVVGMLALPGPMLGYVRYIPWWQMPAILALMALTEARPSEPRVRRLGAFAAAVLLAAASCLIGPWPLNKRLGYETWLVLRRIELEDMLASPTRLRVRPAYPEMAGLLKLMQREWPALAQAETLPYRERSWEETFVDHTNLPGNFFALDRRKDMKKARNRRRVRSDANAGAVLHAVCRDLPKALGNRIFGRTAPNENNK